MDYKYNHTITKQGDKTIITNTPISKKSTLAHEFEFNNMSDTIANCILEMLIETALKNGKN